MSDDASIPLPRAWTKTVRSSVFHAISLAFVALTRAWGSAARNRRPATRLQGALDRVETETALLKEELAIQDARWSRVSPRRRPHFSPPDANPGVANARSGGGRWCMDREDG